MGRPHRTILPSDYEGGRNISGGGLPVTFQGHLRWELRIQVAWAKGLKSPRRQQRTREALARDEEAVLLRP